MAEHQRRAASVPPKSPRPRVGGGASCVPVLQLLPGGQTPRPPRQRLPPIRQFAFCLFHPKPRPSPSPLHLLRDGWQKWAAAYSFSSQRCRSGTLRARLRQAPLSQGSRGSCILGFAQVLKDGPQSHWSMVPLPVCPISPCPLPLGRLQRQPRLLAMRFVPVALLPSWPSLRDQRLCSCCESMQVPVDLDPQEAAGLGRPSRAAWWELPRSLVTCTVTVGVCPVGRDTAFLSLGTHAPIPKHTSPHSSSPSLSQVLDPFSTPLPACTSE